MKQVRMNLWVTKPEAIGQFSRPCIVDYSVNPVGSDTLYQVHHITDARTEQGYDVDIAISINGDMDEMIAAADPKQVAFAKKELGVDLKNLPKKKVVKKPVQKTSTEGLLDGL